MVTALAIDPAEVDHVEHLAGYCVICLVTGIERLVTPTEAERVEREMGTERDR